MWSSIVPQDSTEWFAYGTYDIIGSTLNENVFYASKTMKPFGKVFTFQLVVQENEYLQIGLDDNGEKNHAKHYFRIGKY